MSELLEEKETDAPFFTPRAGHAVARQPLFGDRKRTNILRSGEQRLIRFLVARTPASLSSNMLTGIGFFGSILVMVSLVLAFYFSRNFLLLGIVGFAVNWYGDSLDGRIAYYRNTPRKWFGFSLDIVMDWLGTATIGLGYLVYARGYAEFSAYLLVVFYGWAMIISQLRYKITDAYRIDSGLFGPTEVRIVICLILLSEVLFPGSMRYFVWALCTALLIINILDTRKLLRMGDERDRAEKASSQQP